MVSMGAAPPSKLPSRTAIDSTEYGSWHFAGTTRRLSGRQIRKFRMLAQIIHHKAAARDDLAAVGANQVQRALDQFGSDAAAAQRARGLGVGDDDRLRRPAVIGKGHRASTSSSNRLRDLL